MWIWSEPRSCGSTDPKKAANGPNMPAELALAMLSSSKLTGFVDCYKLLNSPYSSPLYNPLHTPPGRSRP